MVEGFDYKTKMSRLPQLGSLKAFAAAARHESFVLAAQELHVTHGAISKQIKNLEENLGESLFSRRNRAVFLTDRGRQLAERLALVFEDLDQVLSDFRSRTQAQPLIVSCEPTLCLKFLIHNLSDLKNCTGLDVKVLAAGGKVDFRRDHVDLAVRRNDFAIDPRLYVRDLAPEAMVMVSTPEVAAVLRQAGQDDARDAKRRAAAIPALHTRSRPDAWLTWRKGQVQNQAQHLTQPLPYHFGSDIFYEHFYLAIEAATAGQGVALASIHMVASDLAAGRLVTLSPVQQDGTQYLAVSNSDFASDPRRTLFADWLSRRMQAHLSAAPEPPAMQTAGARPRFYP
ncbi:LysR family transcriptional regulator [Allorhizobium taibaishanense]|uniref:HTH-type transcriptional regulator TtuA n=2 Tax=Allorhizobium taibaishanense TaxID=887144 RepID=A0A7W6HKV5_9HYPH|nr:LysR family transcriptional regulator [Allorhizobium taibaishanense]MBB4007103.1 DNA-binding transcriptional LysR family regulator [Allorhizobium taibaishanense]